VQFDGVQAHFENNPTGEFSEGLGVSDRAADLGSLSNDDGLLNDCIFCNASAKVWPVWLSLEPIADPRLTVMDIPAGTTTGSRFASGRSGRCFFIRLASLSLLSGHSRSMGVGTAAAVARRWLVAPEQRPYEIE
jgi:hypothetical protein